MVHEKDCESQALLAAALAYLSAGRSVLPIAQGCKKPSTLHPTTGEVTDLAWKRYQVQRATVAQLHTWFGTAAPVGIGIACGPVSGVQVDEVPYALEVLDVDDAEVLAQFIETAQWQGLGALLARLLHQRTPGGAGHFAYLCTEVAGNTVLARRPRRPDDPEKPDAITTIETRGTGGQAVVAPTPPGIHPEHPERGYELVRGSWEDLPIITPEEREALFNLARSCNTYVAPHQIHAPREGPTAGLNGARPGDALNAHADRDWWRRLLEQHGWTCMHQRGDIDYWQRPGKEGKAWSATLGACGSYFYVFSSNAAPFALGRAYSAFSAYTLLEHGGDWSAAAKALAGQHGSTEPTEDPPLQDARPVVRIGADITRMVDEGQAALLALPAGPVLFQRARRLSIIARGVKAPRWLRRPADAPVIVEAQAAYLDELATKAARWEKLDKRAKKGEEWIEVTPPARFAQTLQARPSWPFPLLEGIIHSPTLRPDGSLLDQPGYDASTGLYFDSHGTTFPPLRAQPTQDDARSALGRLQQVFIDFPFAGRDDRSHTNPSFSAAIAATLTLVGLPAIQGNIPLFGVSATVAGTGKGLLVDSVSTIGTGRCAPKMGQTLDENEELKRLLALALEGASVCCIDNVTHPLGNQHLDMVLTSRTITGRILGQTGMAEAPWNAVLFATGNNLAYRGDMTRRVIPIVLDPRMERPEERTGFTHPNLEAWVRKERPRLVMAALTILRAYCVAGRPAQGLTPYGSFEAWSDLVRQAIVWLGEADPCEGRKDLAAHTDEAYERLATLLTAWEACYPRNTKGVFPAKTLKQVKQEIAVYAANKEVKDAVPTTWDELREALGAFDRRYDGKSLNTHLLGNALRTIEGKVIDLRRLKRCGAERNVTLWCLETV
jgi:hypothetical protein